MEEFYNRHAIFFVPLWFGALAFSTAAAVRIDTRSHPFARRLALLLVVAYCALRTVATAVRATGDVDAADDLSVTTTILSIPACAAIAASYWPLSKRPGGKR